MKILTLVLLIALVGCKPDDHPDVERDDNPAVLPDTVEGGGPPDRGDDQVLPDPGDD